MHGWLEIIGGVALAIAAEPIHETGHAAAARLLTGAWPHVSFWAVHPTAPFKSNSAILGVLAAGDAAVISVATDKLQFFDLETETAVPVGG